MAPTNYMPDGRSGQENLEPVPRLKKQEISTLVLKEKESLSVPAYVSYLHINFIEEQTEMK